MSFFLHAFLIASHIGPEKQVKFNILIDAMLCDVKCYINISDDLKIINYRKSSSMQMLICILL